MLTKGNSNSMYNKNSNSLNCTFLSFFCFFLFNEMCSGLTHQHKPSLILLGLLYSLILNLALKCFVYLKSQWSRLL